MDKKSLLHLAAFTLIIIGLMNTVPRVNAAISSQNWIGETYSGYDSFLGTSVNAYESGAEATLLVRVYSNYWVSNPYWSNRPLNVSAVKVCPDWNINYTSTEVSEESPIVVEPNQYRTFIIKYTIPNTTIASNLVAHTYHIYVEHVNSTTGAKEVIDTWTESDSNLAVYSPEQAVCIEVSQKYAGMSTPTFSYPEAQVMWSRAMLESSQAQSSYSHGDFADAAIHYQAMDDLVVQAFATETTRGSHAADATSTAAMVQSYGSLLLGLGVALFGTGAIIFGLRRR